MDSETLTIRIKGLSGRWQGISGVNFQQMRVSHPKLYRTAFWNKSVLNTAKGGTMIRCSSISGENNIPRSSTITVRLSKHSPKSICFPPLGKDLLKSATSKGEIQNLCHFSAKNCLRKFEGESGIAWGIVELSELFSPLKEVTETEPLDHQVYPEALHLLM
jgi:hypothetical protein